MIFIKDEEFVRGKCPMTKEEIRILSVGKMNLKDDSKVLDIGSGTGSITVQCAKMCTKGKVYSVEKEDEPFNVTKSNIDKFECKNVELIKEEGSIVLSSFIDDDIKFDSIFIGGSGGHLEEIINKCDSSLNNGGTIVMNFITLDNAYKAIDTVRKLNYKVDVNLVSVSKNRGNSLMMIALNPIYIVQCIKGEVTED